MSLTVDMADRYVQFINIWALDWACQALSNTDHVQRYRTVRPFNTVIIEAALKVADNDLFILFHYINSFLPDQNLEQKKRRDIYIAHPFQLRPHAYGLASIFRAT